MVAGASCPRLTTSGQAVCKGITWSPTIEPQRDRPLNLSVSEGGGRRRLECPAACGWHGVSIECHYRWSPHCRPPADDGPPQAKRRRDPAVAAQLFANRVAAVMGKVMLQSHVDQYMGMPDLEVSRALVQMCVGLTCDFIEQELGLLGCPPGGDLVFQSARRAFQQLPAASRLVANRRQVYQRAVPRHLSTSENDKKGAAFFSAHNLVTILLQESATVRKLTIEASETWKTGELFQTRPTVQTDLTHGTRFLDWRAVCGKATAAEARDLRVVLHGWTDEFTPIDGLSQKARVHKYGVVLVSLVNLPLRLRHYADFILMLVLYNCRLMPSAPLQIPAGFCTRKAVSLR